MLDMSFYINDSRTQYNKKFMLYTFPMAFNLPKLICIQLVDFLNYHENLFRKTCMTFSKSIHISCEKIISRF